MKVWTHPLCSKIKQNEPSHGVLSFVHEWSSLILRDKSKKTIFFFCNNVVCKCLLFKLPWMQISNNSFINNSVKAFTSWLPGQSLSFISPQQSLLFIVSVGTALCVRMCWIITAIVSSELIWIWLILTAYSCLIFFSYLESPHLVAQSAACSARGGKIHYDRRSYRWQWREDADAGKKNFFSEPWRVFVVHIPRDKDL